jgi:acetylornithine deacetylase/succinyl-diaminopimelate desuccinylase-like protein
VQGKTVIASQAFAKISMRLVPNQEWEQITELFTKHFMSIAPAGVTVKVTRITEVRVCDYRRHWLQSGNMAYTETFGVPAIPVRSGGSIPIVAFIRKELKAKQS